MATVDELPYRPWTETPIDSGFRWRLGARPLASVDWLEAGVDGAQWIAEKRRVLAAHRHTASAFIDGVDRECEEIAAAVRGELVRRTATDPSSIGMGPRPERDLTELDPLELNALETVALDVAEDLVMMVERDGRMVFGGGVVCFPNRWDLRSKLGTSLSDTHGPVAQLNDQLGSQIDRSFDRLEPSRSFWRLGWGVIDTAEGYTPVDGTGPPRLAEPTVDDLHVRIERETLRRFPETRAVLFTIRTYITPLTTLAERSSEDVVAIAGAINTMSSDIAEYKGIDPHIASVVRDLADRQFL